MQHYYVYLCISVYLCVNQHVSRSISVYIYVSLRISMYICFSVTEVSNIEAAEIKDRTEVSIVSQLFGIDANKLYQGLTTRTIHTREDSVTSRLSHDASLDVRDAFVKVPKSVLVLSHSGELGGDNSGRKHLTLYSDSLTAAKIGTKSHRYFWNSL